MKIYIDTDYKCHVYPGEDLREIETDVFDGKCDEFIEGYRFVPAGEAWTRSDGMTFMGEMVSPWKDYIELMMAQAAYLEEQLADADTALEVVYGTQN